MNRTIPALVTALLLAIVCTTASAACDVSWRFTPRMTGPSRHIDAEVTWRAGNSRTTELALTREWGGVDTFTKAMRDFRTRSAHQWVVDRADPARKIVTHLPRERVTVTYRIDASPADPDSDPISRRDVYRVILGPDWFHFIGYAVFAVPSSFNDDTRPRMCVTVQATADDDWIVSSFGARRARSVTYALRDSPDRLRHAVYFGGKFDVRQREVRGRSIWVARRGPWQFDMDAYADAVTRLVATHRTFWNDFEYPPFAIELLPTHQPVGGAGGTALRNAFVMYAPDDLKVPGEKFEFIIAHEYLHTWIPGRFGSMGEDEAQRYWFSEGFTDFYTHRLLVRAGVWTFDQYARSLNRKIEQYLQSDVRAYDNERVKADFFSDTSVGALAYQRGELLALRWHAKLSERTADGLDAVMRSLLLPQSVEEEAKPPSPLATTRLLDALDTERLSVAHADVERYVEHGELFTFDTETLGPCFEMHRDDKPAMTIGFDRRSVKEGRLVGVDVYGPAYAAGLREGQLISGFWLFEGDVSKDAGVQLRDGEGKTSEVTYRPISRGRRSIPVYAPKPDAATDPACRRWFGLDVAAR